MPFLLSLQASKTKSSGCWPACSGSLICRSASFLQSMVEDASQADQGVSSMAEAQSCSVDQAAMQETCIKPETNHPSLRIDCRANNSQPDIYHSFHSEPQVSNKEQSSSQDQEARRDAPQEFGRRTERLFRDSREDITQDPTSSNESSRPESLGQNVGQTHDKVQNLTPWPCQSQ